MGFDVRGLNAQLFIAFLAANNPAIITPDKVTRLATESRRKGFQIPDVMAHKPQRKEFYEIKPDSDVSKRKGVSKLNNLERFFAREGLPYQRGLSYPRGTREIELRRFRPFPNIELLVLLKVESGEHPPGVFPNGLVTYELCLRAALPVFVLAALAATVILILTRGRGVPKDIPGIPAPTTGSAG